MLAIYKYIRQRFSNVLINPGFIMSSRLSQLKTPAQFEGLSSNLVFSSSYNIAVNVYIYTYTNYFIALVSSTKVTNYKF